MSSLKQTLKIPGVGLREEPKKEQKPAPKKRTSYHRDYQKKIMADPVRREKYLKYQREYHRARKAAEVGA